MNIVHLTAAEFLRQNQKTDIAELIFWEVKSEFVRKVFKHDYYNIDDVMKTIKKPFEDPPTV